MYPKQKNRQNIHLDTAQVVERLISGQKSSDQLGKAALFGLFLKKS
jgi:hypothetical protein